MADDNSSALSLDVIVRDVATQLHKLRSKPPVDPVIILKECEIELSVKATVEGGGGIKFYIFSAEAKAGSEQASKITLKFSTEGLSSPLAMLAQTPEDQGPIKRQ